MLKAGRKFVLALGVSGGVHRFIQLHADIGPHLRLKHPRSVSALASRLLSPSCRRASPNIPEVFLRLGKLHLFFVLISILTKISLKYIIF